MGNAEREREREREREGGRRGERKTRINKVLVRTGIFTQEEEEERGRNAAGGERRGAEIGWAYMWQHVLHVWEAVSGMARRERLSDLLVADAVAAAAAAAAEATV